MARRYSGPATLRVDGRTFEVQADLFTNSADGTYSWGGRLTTSDLAALRAAKQGGTLPLSVPQEIDAEVHVVVADLDANGGVLLRVDGHGRAPYETPGDVARTLDV